MEQGNDLRVLVVLEADTIVVRENAIPSLTVRSLQFLLLTVPPVPDRKALASFPAWQQHSGDDGLRPRFDCRATIALDVSQG